MLGPVAVELLFPVLGVFGKSDVRPGNQVFQNALSNVMSGKAILGPGVTQANYGGVHGVNVAKSGIVCLCLWSGSFIQIA